LLDQQFFANSEHKNYLTKHFVLFHADSQNEAGRELYKEFYVKSTPQVICLLPDGNEVDRISGFDGDNEEYMGKLKDVLEGKNTILNLTIKLEESPDDVKTAAEVVNRYIDLYAFEKTAEFNEIILNNEEKAKSVFVPYGENKSEISAYEYGRFVASYIDWKNVETFLKDFPESSLRSRAIGILGWILRKDKDNQEILDYFALLYKKNPSEPAVLNSLINYYAGLNENSADGIKYIKALKRSDNELTNKNLLENCAKIYLKNDLVEAAIDIYGNDYSSLKIEEKDADALNAYAWFWALKVENLDDALLAGQKAVEIDPENNNIWDTLSMVYWKMKRYEEAIKAEEKALEIVGGESDYYQKQIDAIRKDMQG